MRHSSHHRLTAAVTLLVVALLLIAGYGGWLAPSQFGVVPAVMVLCYPVVAVMALVLAACWLLLRRWVGAIALVVTLLLTWPSLSANFPMHLSKSDIDSTQSFKVLSYNVAAFVDDIADTTHLHPDMRLILDEDADFVIMIQPTTRGLHYDERNLIEPWLHEIDLQYPYRTHSRYDGVELLSKHPFRATPLSLPFHTYDYWPYVTRATHTYAFDITLGDGHQLRLVGAYMTSFQLDDDERRVLDTTAYQPSSATRLLGKLGKAFTARERMALQLRDSLDTSPANLIVCTDLNDVPQSYAYRTLVGDDLRDAYRECYIGYLPTFRDHHMLFHIDHILYRGSMRAVRFRRINDGFSDHYPIVATFEWQ